MHGPAKHGVIVYTNDLDRLAKFYSTLFNMQIHKSSAQMHSLIGDGLNIVVHVPPEPLPDTRYNAVKLFITVNSHAETHERAKKLGGQSLEGEWANPVFSVTNIADCDGNIIQLREFSALPSTDT